MEIWDLHSEEDLLAGTGDNGWIGCGSLHSLYEFMAGEWARPDGLRLFTLHRRKELA